MSETEKDPTGRSAHDPGAKLDQGKPRVGLVLGGFSRALEEVSKVGTFGAQKYSDSGWAQVPDGVSRYTDAMLRHWLKECAGEVYDQDSGMFHAAQLAWNALARLELYLREAHASSSNAADSAVKYRWLDGRDDESTVAMKTLLKEENET